MIITLPSVNIYKKPNKKSEITSQILYGEKFKIIIKNSKWIKVKTIKEKVIWPKKYKLMMNYKPFLKYNSTKMKMIIKRKINDR